MSWRYVVPVDSPVSSRAVIEGIKAAVGLRPDARGTLVDALCQRYDACDAVLTDSGTSALILALRALVPPGGTVAYPGYACIDLTTAAIGAGIRVRLYDIDPGTLSPDLDSVRQAIDRGVDAIVVAHLFGYPADVIGVKEIAAEKGIPVVEDAAQGAGGSLRGTRLGALGDVSIRSFGRGKGTTAGSGGALLVRTPVFSDSMRRGGGELTRPSRGAKQLLTMAAQAMLSHPSLFRLPASIPGLRLGEMVYHPPQPPRTMTVASAAALPWTIGLDEREVRTRRARATDLLKRASRVQSIVPIHAVTAGQSGYLRLALIDGAGDRIPHPELGAMRAYPMTLEEHKQLQSILLPGERAGKGSERLRDRLFTVPTHSRMHGSDLDRLETWFSQPQAGPTSAVR